MRRRLTACDRMIFITSPCGRIFFAVRTSCESDIGLSSPVLGNTSYRFSAASNLCPIHHIANVMCPIEGQGRRGAVRRRQIGNALAHRRADFLDPAHDLAQQCDELNAGGSIAPVGAWRLTPWVIVPIDGMARRRDYNQAARRRTRPPGRNRGLLFIVFVSRL
jgi:hypothetical protein